MLERWRASRGLERIDGSTPAHYHAEHMARYAFVRDRIGAAHRVLDLGCGTGYAARSLCDRADLVVALDVSLQAIREARARYAHPRAHFAVARGERLPFSDGSFDRILSFEVIEHLNPEAQPQYLAEIRRTLARGGQAFLSTPNRRFTSGEANPYHLKEFDLQELRALLDGYFPRVRLFGQRCTSPVARVYDGRLAGTARRIKRALRVQFLLPHWAKRLGERILTGSSMARVGVDDYEFVERGIEECRVFLAICEAPASPVP
jgi:SAM-dependent methyltransferase